MLTTTTQTVANPVKGLTYQELDILHCLRGFCAFYVVIHHAKYMLWSGGRQFLTAYPRETWNVLDYAAFALDMLSSAGFEMVVFFFVLSGFFIRYAQRKRHRPAVAFYINRIVRIYPPYLFSVLLSCATLVAVALLVPQILDIASNRQFNTGVALAWKEMQHLNLLSVFRILIFSEIGESYIGSNGVYWSLLPEALFYLCIPLAFSNIRAYYIVSILAYAAGAVCATLHVVLAPVTQSLLVFNFYFAVGVALYDAVVDTNMLAVFRRTNGWLLGAATIVLFLVMVALAILQWRFVSGIVAIVLAVICVCSLLVDKVSRQNPFVRLMHSIGIFSFSLYLFHSPLLLLCYGALVYFTGEQFTYVRYYWLAVPLITSISYLLYWCTERVSVNYFRKV